jgi:thioesterase domain-containing protein
MIFGDILRFASLAKLLGSDRPFVALQPAGTFQGDRPLERIETMAERYCAEIEAQQPQGPYNIMGWSFGGLVAFEIAQRLHRKGAEVGLFVLDSISPDRNRTDEDLSGRPAFLAQLGQWLQLDIELPPEDLFHSDPMHLVELVLERARDAHHQDAQRLRAGEMFRAHAKAMLAYRTRYYPGKMVLAMPRDRYAHEKDDPVGRFTRSGRWYGLAREIVRLEVPGDHQSMINEPNVAVLAQRVRPLLLDPAPTTRQEPAALSWGRSAGEREEMVESFARQWRRTPYSRVGAWHHHDLLWLGRVLDTRRDPRALLFSEIEESILALQNRDGTIGGPAPHPYSNFIVALTFANTLGGWDARRYDGEIRRALAYALQESDRLAEPPYSGLKFPYDRHYRNPGFLGKWVLAPFECGQLFEHEERLTKEQRERWKPYADLQRQRPPRTDYARLFAGDFANCHFAEVLGAEAWRSPEARRLAEENTHLPVACTARYYQMTGDDRVLDRLRRLLPRMREGLRHGARLQEASFSLRFLIKGGIDVRRHFQAELDYLLSTIQEDGVPVEEFSTDRDCDSTALALWVAASTGTRSRLPTRHLETWWDEEKFGYQDLNGNAATIAALTIIILEAYLRDPEISPAERQNVWRRTIRKLETEVWEDSVHHLSPIYTWENVVSALFPNEHRFPEDRTRVHQDALELILSCEQPAGGYQTCHSSAPNLEETALALLAFKSVLSCPIDEALRRRVTAAAQRAESFLVTRRERGYDPEAHPDLWIAKVQYAPVNVVEATIVASLYRPIPTQAT